MNRLATTTTLVGTLAVAAVAICSANTAGAQAAATHTAHHAPQIVHAAVTCVVSSYEDLPGMPHTPLYSPRVSWKVKHASGMALSVDDPGLVGSYGTYGTSGHLLLGGGCYTDDGTTTITFYTVGGHGKRAHKTIVKTGTKTRPTAPPFS